MNTLVSGQPPSLMLLQNLFKNSSNQANLPSLLASFLKEGKGVHELDTDVCTDRKTCVNGDISTENKPIKNEISIKEVECVIDRELKKMEFKLLNHIDDRFDQLQKKLDSLVTNLETCQCRNLKENKPKLELPQISDLKIINESKTPQTTCNENSLSNDLEKRNHLESSLS